MPYRIKIENDDDALDPRGDTNVGTMYTWHRRYSLGDRGYRDLSTVDEEILKLIEPCDSTFAEDPHSHEEIMAKFERHYVVLPLYLYDHSGITISTKPFSCPWDSGKIGFIFCDFKTAKKTFEFEGDQWSQALIDNIETTLHTEVEIYNQYLTGDVHGFTVEKIEYDFEIPIEDVDVDVTDNDLNWVDEDSCWGFFGDDPLKNGMMDHLTAFNIDDIKAAATNHGKWLPLRLAPVPITQG